MKFYHFAKRFYIIFGSILSDLAPEKLPHCDYLLVCHDNDRGYEYEGLAYSQLLDSLRENLLECGLRVATVSTSFSLLNREKGAGSPISINGLHARSHALSKISLLFVKSKDLHVANRQINLWIRLLTKIQPIVVIGIQQCEALCAAGKRLGISVYDLQHGVIERSKDPTSYYSSRSISAFGREGIPELVICWNYTSADVIRTMWPCTSTLVTGNPWLQRFLTPDPHDNLVTKEIDLLKQRLSKVSGKKIVLLTTQWVPTFDRIEIPSNIREAILHSTNEGVQWCIKFHPVEMKRFKMTTLVKHAINALGEEAWDDMLDLSLHALPAILNFASYHVTGSSASTYEAACFDIKTGLWDHRPEVATWFKDEIINNKVEFLPLDSSNISSKIVKEVSSHAPRLCIDH